MKKAFLSLFLIGIGVAAMGQSTVVESVATNSTDSYSLDQPVGTVAGMGNTQGTQVTNTQDASVITTYDVKPEDERGWKPRSGGISFNYTGRFSDAAAINMDFRFPWLNIGGEYSVSGPDAWCIYAGAATRYYFTPKIFIDGAAGIYYTHVKIKTRQYVGQESYYVFNQVHYRDKYETVETSDGNVGFYLLPRLGFMISKKVGINIGYMMGAPKMKFDGFFDKGDVMLGICVCY